MSVKKLYVTGGSIIPQSDWNQTDDTQADFIKNKPCVATGECENSLVGNDIEWNQSISANSIALGSGTIAGSKGFRIIESVDNSNGTGAYTLDGYTDGFAVGDVYTLRIDSYYDRRGTITAINGNAITVDNFVADTLVSPRTAYTVRGTWQWNEKISVKMDESVNFTCDGVNYTGIQYVDEYVDIYEFDESLKYTKADGNRVIAYAYFTSLHGANRWRRASLRTIDFGASQEVSQAFYNALLANAQPVDGEAEILAVYDGEVNTFRVPDKPTIGNVDIGVCAAAFGANGVAGGRYSTVFGYGNKADGKYSAAFGHGNRVQYGGFVAGQGNEVNGHNAFSAGRENVVAGNIATALGLKNIVSGLYAFASGQGNVVSGEKATAFGEVCTASGRFAFAGGWNSNALGSESFAFGSKANATTNSAVAIGDSVTASGKQSVAVGRGGTASGDMAFVCGLSCEAKGIASRACGMQNHAIGNYSEAMAGQNCYANGDMSISTGISSIANGKASFAGGWSAQTDGELSFAFGSDVTAGGRASVAFGDRTKAGSASQMVLGKYNVEDTEGKYAFIIGNGTGDTARSNALAVRWDGNIEFAGSLTLGNVTITSDQLAKLLTLLDYTEYTGGTV